MENEQILDTLAQVDEKIEQIRLAKARVKIALAVVDYFAGSDDDGLYMGADLMKIDALFEPGECKALLLGKAKEIIEKDCHMLSVFTRGLEPCDVQAVEQEPGTEDAAEIDVDADPLPEEEPAPPEQKKRSKSTSVRMDRAKLEEMYFKQNKTVSEILKETGWAKSSVYNAVDEMRRLKISTAKECVRR